MLWDIYIYSCSFFFLGGGRTFLISRLVSAKCLKLSNCLGKRSGYKKGMQKAIKKTSQFVKNGERLAKSKLYYCSILINDVTQKFEVFLQKMRSSGCQRLVGFMSTKFGLNPTDCYRIINLHLLWLQPSRPPARPIFPMKKFGLSLFLCSTGTSVFLLCSSS